MRRGLTLVTAAGAVLVVAGFGLAGLAHLVQDGTQTVTATFSAARERAAVRTCAGPDGTYEIVNGRYAGQSTSAQPLLNGPIVLTVNAVYNRTEQVGWIRGTVRVRGSEHPVQARLVGTLTQGASDTRVVDGFVDGPAGGHGAKLFGSLTASFTGTGGFSAGSIGAGGTNIALLAGRVCRPAKSELEASGRIVVLSSSQIAIQRNPSNLVTCAIRAGVSPPTNGLRVGDTVEITCGLVDNEMTLLKVKKKGKDDDDD
jgi:hypothetical protein